MSGLTVGLRIRELREARCYSRNDFAEMADISPKFLYEIETGKKGFSADVLCRIARALSVSCDYIMMGSGTKYCVDEETLSRMSSLDPKQLSRVEEILRILCEICINS